MKWLPALLATWLAAPVSAGAAAIPGESFAMHETFYGLASLVIFFAAYVLVMLESRIQMRKSKPVLIAAGVIWVLLALAWEGGGQSGRAGDAFLRGLTEYVELFLFLLPAMTYINALEERDVFQSLRAFLVSRGYSLRQVYWATGALAFLLSPFADNLTTALLLGAVVMAVGGNNHRFICLACINVVVGANAGGAFSPFGDITTLMVWQKEKIEFHQFFVIAVPSAINWLVPAVAMNFAVSEGMPGSVDERVVMKHGAKTMMALFAATVATAVWFHVFLDLPAAAGMMLGLGYLGAFSYYLKKREGRLSLYGTFLGTRADESLNPLRLLRRRGRDLGRYLESLPYPAFMIDTSHTIVHWNSALQRLTGFTAAEMVGTRNQWKPFYDNARSLLSDLVLDGRDREIRRRYQQLHRHHLATGENAYDAARYVDNLGDEGLYLLFSAAPVTDREGNLVGAVELFEDVTEHRRQVHSFDVMERVAHIQWDTLLFFYGVILCVAGLGEFGYLGLVSGTLYTHLGPTLANTLVGVLSAIVDNVPVMFAVLSMDPAMSLGQWQLVTLTVGTGGSLLAVGSAAGVALLGTARGIYSFGGHLKWAPVIALGYALSILCHLWLNAGVM
ncbi:MAG: sodium:proton antiporter NhaD [Candidatus Tectomicrobia bacterium]|nr:sodium:proton antiporter NhaD [Candidatus Tectomicrobia bacterium]